MTTGRKVALGCGSIGCLGMLVLAVAVASTGSCEEAEKRGREWRQSQESRSPQQEEPERGDDSQFLASSDGSPMGVSDFVLDSLHHSHDIGIGKGKVLPENRGVLWKVSQIVKGSFWSRYAIYEYISNDVDAQFAVELDGDPPMIGSDLPNGCYRFTGTIEGKNVLGTVVPMLLFQKEQIDAPLCKRLDQQ